MDYVRTALAAAVIAVFVPLQAYAGGIVLDGEGAAIADMDAGQEGCTEVSFRIGNAGSLPEKDVHVLLKNMDTGLKYEADIPAGSGGRGTAVLPEGTYETEDIWLDGDYLSENVFYAEKQIVEITGGNKEFEFSYKGLKGHLNGPGASDGKIPDETDENAGNGLYAPQTGVLYGSEDISSEEGTLSVILREEEPPDKSLVVVLSDAGGYRYMAELDGTHAYTAAVDLPAGTYRVEDVVSGAGEELNAGYAAGEEEVRILDGETTLLEIAYGGNPGETLPEISETEAAEERSSGKAPAGLLIAAATALLAAVYLVLRRKENGRPEA